jgi:hypothetical protein
MALLQPSGVSLDTKKEKKLSHCNQPKKNNQSACSTAEIRKIKYHRSPEELPKKTTSNSNQ